MVPVSLYLNTTAIHNQYPLLLKEILPIMTIEELLHRTAMCPI